MARHSTWTDERRAVVAENWGRKSKTWFLQTLFPATWRTIETEASRQGLTRRGWSEQDDRWLTSNLPVLGEDECARKLRRTPGSVRTRAWRLKIEMRTRKLCASLVADLLGVTPDSVYRWVHQKKLKSYSIGDVRRFVMAYPEAVNLTALGDRRQDFFFLLAGEVE